VGATRRRLVVGGAGGVAGEGLGARPPSGDGPLSCHVASLRFSHCCVSNCQSVSQSISQPIQIVLPASSEPIPHCLPVESEMDYKKKHQATRPHLWPSTKFQNFFVIMEYEQQWGEMRTTVAYILITKQSAEICHCTYFICS